MKQQIRAVTLSLQHLSSVVLPELKRVSSVILASASDAGITHASTLETLLVDAHRIADAATKGLALVVKEDRTTDDGGVVQTRKPPLAVDVELEVLRFCARVDLDKMQLVSKAKRVLVDNMSDTLALHNVYCVRTHANDHGVDEKLCTVTYAAFYEETSTTDFRKEALMRGNDHNGWVLLNMNPFQYMRNAFVGAATLEPPEESTTEFERLLGAFLSHRKGAMQVGIVRLWYTMNARWIAYLVGTAADDLRAKCFVVHYCNLDGDSSTFIDAIFAERTIRKAKRITISVGVATTLRVDQIASLAELATDCGDVRRIDVDFYDTHFAECLTLWVQALISVKTFKKLVNNVIFHCWRDTELPGVLADPIARLPKRKWHAMTHDGETCEMEDVEEKSVFTFKNEHTATEITAVVARYSYDSWTKLTCNFIMNPSENLDIGDFSQKHIKTTGLGWDERLIDSD